ncbi:MAG TPA: hypothetical protein VG298_15125 [Acidimicrobiales bacterium]|jgi:phospholipase C|nr:hypothetical protein [Acidimicrobiales bacterium]
MTGAFDFAAPPDPRRPELPIPLADLGLVGDLVFANAVNSALGTLGDGIPYPVPPNTVPHQEPGPPRRSPSGVVPTRKT